MSRRKAVARNNGPKEFPARAEDVLNRPDPNEKPDAAVYSLLTNSTSTFANAGQIMLGQAIGSPMHSSRASAQSNPFDDARSIQTTSTGTQGTNVIPIALVAPGSVPNTSSKNSASSSSANQNPTRPDRSPELNLNLDHVNVSKEGLRSNTPGSGGDSQGTNRNSYVSNMSYNSDFLNEIPMIVTPSRGTVRQVLGVVKAEVVQAPPSTPSSASTESSKATLKIKPSIRSPLAESSFGPIDVLKEAEEEDEDISTLPNPFADKLVPSQDLSTKSSSFANGSDPSVISDWSPEEPALPWTRRNDKSRPSSWSTQSGSIIADIGSATRVQVGLSPIVSPTMTTPGSESSKGLYRMTSGRLVSPAITHSSVDNFEQQQEKVVAQRSDKRVSSGSTLSMASTKADSILESFPFVPPSPISDRPARVAPRSPLAQQQYTAVPEEKQSNPPVTNPNLSNSRSFAMSIGSQISTLSAGLGSFPFQIESPSSDYTPSPSTGRQRASLDTLALTRDLSSYPLGFDKELHDNYPVSK